jgi:AGCS family alanine or glycine:cation symporter
MASAWHVADIANGLMVIPNLVALVALSRVIVDETSKFLILADK